ncbi:fatty acid hydroxylase [Epibacterium sp. SM1979]|uniref:Fatty acid hydroxylase n=1 Tax=Tritonibacter litoralis TaxID=2662264 RepID=A0A843YDH2_9RHOB|nr:sterol desaturase family protein [Tritonibacter litoralis]MQQ07898.1 fatty acid hydroxylase [Tritonibacter litoralis]
MDMFSIIFSEFLSKAAGPSSRLWPVYLLITLGICFALYRRQNISTSFLQWLFPKAIYFHASHLVDVKIFVLGKIFSTLGLFSLVFFSAVVSKAIVSVFGGSASAAPLHPVWIAALLLLVSDFSTYWVHRIHHENRIIWPFHSLHHSAEVMTPVTVYRKHPIYDLISSFVRGILVGVLQGIMLCVFLQEPSFAAIAGVNACYVLFNIAGSNLRHSHVWLSFGRVIEHFIISPAQHQIHHSIDPRHYNKNYGEVLAIWDWMFGTLYVPQAQERIEFGLGDKAGNRLRQRHDSLTAALYVPIRDSAVQIKKALTRHSGASAATPKAMNRTPSPAKPPAE